MLELLCTNILKARALMVLQCQLWFLSVFLTGTYILHLLFCGIFYGISLVFVCIYCTCVTPLRKFLELGTLLGFNIPGE